MIPANPTLGDKIKLKAEGGSIFVTRVLLRFYSRYYDTLLNPSGPWSKPNQNILSTDADNSVLQLFAHWLQNGPFFPDRWGPATKDLMRLYAWADEIDSLTLRRDIIDHFALNSDMSLKMEAGHFDFAVSILPENAPLIDFMAELMAAHDFDLKQFDVNTAGLHTFPSSILAGILKQYQTRSAIRDKRVMGCAYHEHESDDEKSWSGFSLHCAIVRTTDLLIACGGGHKL